MRLAAPAFAALILAAPFAAFAAPHTLDHLEIGRNRPISRNVIDSKHLERVAGEKPLRTFSQPALVIERPWARPAAPGANSAGYVSITNKGSTPDRLVSAASPATKRIEIHQSMTMNGMAMMHSAGTGVVIPPGGAAALSPGGYHLMLVGVKAGLKVGDVIRVSLVFAKAGKIEADFPVPAPGSQP